MMKCLKKITSIMKTIEELLVRNKNFKPSSIKYESYFSLSELHTIRTKFNEVYKTTFDYMNIIRLNAHFFITPETLPTPCSKVFSLFTRTYTRTCNSKQVFH